MDNIKSKMLAMHRSLAGMVDEDTRANAWSAVSTHYSNSVAAVAAASSESVTQAVSSMESHLSCDTVGGKEIRHTEVYAKMMCALYNSPSEYTDCTERQRLFYLTAFGAMMENSNVE